jgi:hypothetical protein
MESHADGAAWLLLFMESSMDLNNIAAGVIAGFLLLIGAYTNPAPTEPMPIIVTAAVDMTPTPVVLQREAK